MKFFRRKSSAGVLCGGLASIVVLWVVLMAFLDEPRGSISLEPTSKRRNADSTDDDHHNPTEVTQRHSAGGKRRHDVDDEESSGKCVAADVQTEISRFGRQSRFASQLKALCDTKCHSVPDADKRPPSADASWRPPFCSPDAGMTPRMDHGCYSLSKHENEHDGVALSSFEEDCDKLRGVTAIFSTLGERFYGPGGQEYVWESVRQWRLFHPVASRQDADAIVRANCYAGDVRFAKNRIFLITNSSRLKEPLMVRNASVLSVRLVGHEELFTEEWQRYDHVFYIQGYMHPGGNRETGNKHFNRLVTSRFFAMQELMRRDSLRNIVHLENDVMVYTSMVPTVAAVRGCGWRMASLFPHLSGVIPGLLYIRSASDLSEFTTFVNDFLSCGKSFGKAAQKGYANDMTYLKNFYQLRGGQWLGDLPSVKRPSGSNCVADKLPDLLHDGASFGQWYSFAVKSAGGPRGNATKLPVCPRTPEVPDDSGAYLYFTSGCAEWERVLKKYYASIEDGAPVSRAKPPENIRQAMRKGRFVDATPGELVRWRRDGEGRLVPWWGQMQLSSLHIHAKNLYWFRSK